MTNNEIMKSYLKELVIAPLLADGFTGQYPHYRRVREDYIELVSIQTNQYGGSFTIEVSVVFSDLPNKNYVGWDGLTIDQLTVWNTNDRYRLKGMYDGWFYYRDLYVKHILGFPEGVGNYLERSQCEEERKIEGAKKGVLARKRGKTTILRTGLFKSHPRNQHCEPKKILVRKTPKPGRFRGFVMPFLK